MSESDLSVLRRLADDGNEEAGDRLAELAGERGDIEELRRLADEGVERAGDRLAELDTDEWECQGIRHRAEIVDGPDCAVDSLTGG